jgi:hypothetical protein
MSWQTQLNGDPLPWLLEAGSPGVRYLALRDLIDVPSKAEVNRARTAAHKRGPISVILRNMEQEGYWSKPGPGYNPKYRSTVWSMIALAQLGASIEEDQRIAQACNYVLDHSLADGGKFTSLTSGDPSGTIDCLQGNLCWALLELGCDDPRLERAFDWMARSVTGEGIASWSSLLYKTGPTFACGVNAGLPCAWGGTKVLLAMARLPQGRRTPVIRRAIRRAVDFFLSVDPAAAAYPTRKGDKPSRNWWKFGFPVFYVTDLLQLSEALIALGYAHDRRLAKALQIIREKQDSQGRWPFEDDYKNGKMWQDFGKRGQPNKWVTLRALRVLKAASA